jgi:phage gp29-like protein
MLLDAYGRPVKTSALKTEHAGPTMTGVRTIWTDTVAGGLTPDRLAAILRSAADGDHDSYLTLAEEMEERDLHYACELSKRKLAVGRLPLTVEAASDAAGDVKLADEVRSLLRKPGVRNMIKDLLDALGKGYSVVEIDWQYGAVWTPRAYKWRDPKFFQFDQLTRSEVRLRDDAEMMDGLPLAPYKFLVHKPHIKSGIPIRGGLARLAAWAWMCKGYTIKDWLAFAEVFGMPLRLGKYGPGASEADKAVLRMAVANLGTDAAAVFPQGMEIELIEAAKAGSIDFFQRLADYLDAQISRGILGQTATTQGTPGKLGNDEAQSKVRDDIRDDDAEQLEETINRDLIRAFIDLNHGPQAEYPTVQLRAETPEDTKALAEALDKLVPLGLRVEQSVIRDRMGLPDPAANAKPEDLLQPPAAPAPADLASADNRAGHSCPHCATAANRAGDEDDTLDDTADEALAGWERVMAPVAETVEDLIEELLAEGGTIEDLRDRLTELAGTLPLAGLIESLAEATFKARGLGDATDDLG